VRFAQIFGIHGANTGFEPRGFTAIADPPIDA
jgi:hypothetical protein